MVGVPGKSKGCVTCRRRKIRCDEGKPTCNNCRKSRRTCEGYAREKKFIPQYENQPVSSSTAVASSSRKPNVSPSTSNDPIGVQSARATLWPDDENLRPVGSLTGPITNQKAFDEQFAGLFMQALAVFEPGPTNPSVAWFPMTWQLADEGTLRLAMRALCVTRVGRMNEDQSLVQYGHAIYGRALLSLQKDLYNTQTAYTVETSSTIRVMTFYELFDSVSNGVGGFATHAKGFARVIEGGGVERFKQALDEGILRGCRRIPLIWSMVGRKEIFLARPEWRPSESSPFFVDELLLHLGLNVAAQFDRLDRSIKLQESRSVPSANTAAEVLRALNSLEGELIDWEAKLRLSIPPNEPLYWPDGRFTDSENSDTLGFSFRSLHQAVQVLTYWAIRLLLDISLAAVVDKLPEIIERQPYDNEGVALVSMFPQALIDMYTNSHPPRKRIEIANNIIRGMEYLTQPDAGLENMHGGLFPLSTALICLSDFDKTDTEYRRGGRIYKFVMSKVQAAKDWYAGRSYMLNAQSQGPGTNFMRKPG